MLTNSIRLKAFQKPTVFTDFVTMASTSAVRNKRAENISEIF